MVYRSTKISARLRNVLGVQRMLRWLCHDSGGLFNYLDFCRINIISSVRDYAKTCGSYQSCCLVHKIIGKMGQRGLKSIPVLFHPPRKIGLSIIYVCIFLPLDVQYPHRVYLPCCENKEK